MGEASAALVLIMVAGAPVLGSFIGLVAYRLPRRIGIVLPRSFCDACGTPLAIRDLVPIVSWVGLKGRCRHCGSSIDGIYPVLEILAIGVGLWACVVFDGWLAWVTCGLGWTLLALAAMDLRQMVLADPLVLPLGLSGLAVGLAIGNRPWDHAIGAVAGLFIFLAVGEAYRRSRGRDGLGFGDVKLFAAAGAWVTWLGLPTVVLWATLSALLAVGTLGLMGRRIANDRPIPFGPHLCLGLWLTWLYGPLELGVTNTPFITAL